MDDFDRTRQLKMLGWFRFSRGTWASPEPKLPGEPISMWYPNLEAAWDAHLSSNRVNSDTLSG